MKRAICIGAALAALAGPVSAHHSFAMFDQTRTVSLRGAVKEFQWVNPHAWIQVMAADPSGKPVEWSIEMNGLASLSRQGWKRTTLKMGDPVTVQYHPLRDGSPGGSFVSVTLPDGQVLGQRPAAPVPAAN